MHQTANYQCKLSYEIKVLRIIFFNQHQEGCLGKLAQLNFVTIKLYAHAKFEIENSQDFLKKFLYKSFF